MTFREHLALLRAGSWLIVPSIVIAVIVAIVISGTLPRRWEARATLYVGQALTASSFDYSSLLASQLLTPTYARLVTTSEVLEAVADDLGLDVEPEDLAQRVLTEVPPGGTLIAIVAGADTPGDAARLANALGRELVSRALAGDGNQAEIEATAERLAGEIDATRGTLLDLLADGTLSTSERATVEQLQLRLTALEQTRASITDELASRSPNAVTIVDPAQPPLFPAGPSRFLITGVAAASAAAISVALVYLIAGLRRPRPPTG